MPQSFNGFIERKILSSSFVGFIENKKDSSSNNIGVVGLYPFKEFTFNALPVGDYLSAFYSGPALSDCREAYAFSQSGVVTSTYGVGGNDAYPNRITGYVSSTTITIKFTTDTAFSSDGVFLLLQNRSTTNETISIYNDDTNQLILTANQAATVQNKIRFEKMSFPLYTFVPGITYRIVVVKGPHNIRYNATNGTTAVLKNTMILPNPLGATITTTFNTNSSIGSNFDVWGLSIPEIANLNNSNWIYNTDYFSMGAINGYQLWTVPRTGSYQITAAGARGGTAKYQGGRGAVINGTFNLQQGQKIWICVGQMGGDGNTGTSSDQMGAGGGGGSFIVLADPSNPTDHTSLNTIPLLIAAGGQGSIEFFRSGNTPADGSASSGTTDSGFSASAFPGGYNKGVTGSLQFRGSVSSGGLTGVTTSYNIITAGGFGGGRSWDDAGGQAGGYDIAEPSISPSGTVPTYSYSAPFTINPSGTSGANYGSGYVYIKLL